MIDMGHAFVALIAAGLLLLSVLPIWPRRKIVAQAADRQPDKAADPYFSAAAMRDFEETKPFGDARWATADELHRALQGAHSHGEPPTFKE